MVTPKSWIYSPTFWGAYNGQLFLNTNYLIKNVLQAQSKRPLQKMATNSLWEFLRLFLPAVLLFGALVALSIFTTSKRHRP